MYVVEVSENIATVCDRKSTKTCQSILSTSKNLAAIDPEIMTDLLWSSNSKTSNYTQSAAYLKSITQSYISYTCSKNKVPCHDMSVKVFSFLLNS